MTVHSFSYILVLFNFVNKTKVLKIFIGSFLLIVILIQMWPVFNQLWILYLQIKKTQIILNKASMKPLCPVMTAFIYYLIYLSLRPGWNDIKKWNIFEKYYINYIFTDFNKHRDYGSWIYATWNVRKNSEGPDAMRYPNIHVMQSTHFSVCLAHRLI